MSNSILSFLTSEWNRITKDNGPCLVHFHFGNALFALWVKANNDAPPTAGVLGLRSGTIRLDPTLEPWGYTYTLERLIPMEFRHE